MWYDRQGRPITVFEAEQLLRSVDARRVAISGDGDYEVSTVHLVLDHSFVGAGPPIIFETMVFGPPRDGEAATDMRGYPVRGVYYTDRYATEDAAREGHQRVVEHLRAGHPLDEL